MLQSREWREVTRQIKSDLGKLSCAEIQSLNDLLDRIHAKAQDPHEVLESEVNKEYTRIREFSKNNSIKEGAFF
jgi:hypothetical protein